MFQQGFGGFVLFIVNRVAITHHSVIFLANMDTSLVSAHVQVMRFFSRKANVTIFLLYFGCYLLSEKIEYSIKT